MSSLPTFIAFSFLYFCLSSFSNIFLLYAFLSHFNSILLALIISSHFSHFSFLTSIFFFPLHGFLKCLALIPPSNHCKHNEHFFAGLFCFLFPFIHAFSCLLRFAFGSSSLQFLHLPFKLKFPTIFSFL